MNLNPKKSVDGKMEQPINLAQKAIPISASSQPISLHSHLQDSSKSLFTTLRLPTPPRPVPVTGSTSVISSQVPTSQILSATKPSSRHVVTTTVYPVMSLGGAGTPVPMASIIRGTVPQTIAAGTTLYSSHIPRGPAAVASISTGPKSAVATPILRPAHASTLQQMTVRTPTLAVSRTVTSAPNTQIKASSLTIGPVIDIPKGNVQTVRAPEPSLRAAKPLHISQPMVQHVQQIAEKVHFKTAAVLQPRTCASTCVVTIAPAPSTSALGTAPTLVSGKTASVVVPPKGVDSTKKGVVVSNSMSAASPLSIPIAKVHPQPSPRPRVFEAENSRNIYIAHPSPAVVLSSTPSENRSESSPVRFASLSRPGAYTVPRAAYFYESYPVQNALPVHSYSAAPSPTATLRPGIAPVQSVPSTHPVMVTVDATPLHASTFTTAASVETPNPTMHYTTASLHPNHNTSPRPSILRKRASDGVSTVKKNLLSSMPGSGPASPHPEHSSPKPTESSSKENGCVAETESCNPVPIKLEPHVESSFETGGANGTNQVVVEASPRKKPRKQQLAATELLESHSTDGEEAYESTKKEIFGEEEDRRSKCVTFCRRPTMSLLNSYRHTWKSRHNHFLRHADVKPRDDKKCTVNELANQKGVVQKTNGWKIYHLTTQLDNVADLESAVHSRLTGLLEFVEKSPPWKKPLPCEEEKTLVKVSDLIKGNLQRSKIAQDQVGEMKQQVVRMLEHRAKVVQIINKYVSKRPIKKKNNN